ncbi:MAG: rod shape-determining protein [Kurthia sp.]|nr:rod shape-determining protein [Candidatus Kurthia equi]
MFSKDIGIDLGTTNILIFQKGKGVILNEPTVIAFDEKTKKIVAVGETARKMVGRSHAGIRTIRPLKDGVINDFDSTEELLKFFLKKLNLKGFLSKPRILICCPSNITLVEQKAIKDVAIQAGGKSIFIEEEPKVAAIGAGMDIYQPSGNMVIDIGGGTADIAVLSMGEVVVSESLKVAGNQFDQDILNYIKKKYKLLIGENTAEIIKIEIGSLILEKKNEVMEIRGRDMVSGLPRSIEITTEEFLEAVNDTVALIIQSAKNILEKTPPELSADIIDKGIMLTGGGALLPGIDSILSDELLVPVYVADNPMNCVVDGTGILLTNMAKKK